VRKRGSGFEVDDRLKNDSNVGDRQRPHTSNRRFSLAPSYVSPG